MRKTLTARQLAEASDLARKERRYSSEAWAKQQLGGPVDNALAAEVLKGSQVAVLADIRFSTKNGRKTVRHVDCLEDGRPVTYNSDYEFQVIAVTVNGKRLPFSTL